MLKTNRYSSVGSEELDIGIRIPAHPDLIEGPAEKGSKGGNKGDFAPAGEAESCSNHVLFRNIHLEESIWICLLESLRLRRVAHLCIQTDNLRIFRKNSDQTIAVGVSSGYRVPV